MTLARAVVEDNQQNSSFSNYNCGTCQRDSLTGSCEISVQSLEQQILKVYFLVLFNCTMDPFRGRVKVEAFWAAVECVCVSAPCVMSSSRRRYSCLTVMGVFGYVCEWVRAHVTWGVDVKTNSELLTS